MEEKNFSLAPTPEEQISKEAESPPACHCPLSAIPAEVWRQLFRKPFRKRHPVIFWGGCAISLVLLLCLPVLLREDPGPFNRSECLALVTVRGVIADAADTLQWLHEIDRRKNIKGVLLRVDSPGGGAAASQEIYAALAHVGKSKPVVVSMGSVAASGGLMVSMAGERVFATPSTVTGSIGVRMDIPQLQGLLDKLGLSQQTLVTAPYKNAGSYLRELSPDEKIYFESVLKDMHNQFVQIVADGRGMAMQDALKLSDGKIFTGREAKELGLIDELGGQDVAHRWLAQQTGIPFDRKLLTKSEKKMFRLQDFFKALLSAEIFNLPDAAWQTPIFLYRL